jgi:hypothetical protein
MHMQQLARSLARRAPASPEPLTSGPAPPFFARPPARLPLPILPSPHLLTQTLHPWPRRAVARDSAKNYQLWNHRAKVAAALGPGGAAGELAFAARFLDADEKNYHAWAHRQVGAGAPGGLGAPCRGPGGGFWGVAVLARAAAEISGPAAFRHRFD